MTALLTDPGPVIVGWSLLALVVGVAVVCVVAAWGPKPKTLDELLAEDAAEGRLPDSPVIWSGGTTLPNRAAEYHGSEQWGR